jgi:deoxyadenosine/deoxycytidine kinase
MLISVDGCVGVGKTTVATGLASLRGSRLLLEDFESNPFLRAFYEDPVGSAIETEFAFLLLHFHTRVLKKTGNLKLVMRTMGQKDVKTAMKYQHPELEIVRTALNETAPGAPQTGA